ncbi:hypothetical protein DSM3645_10717 [Blastopirellula marina DSM 3645]|uniref:Uncharacterized protein n=1 Tax=Blastopirellula marina DSM 3645 TaxID=314230 RepID=A3ZSN9_9BACT|nr:hypothetical protein DSM3645_10717 [Blastopirellula marina DSM 3645]
MRKRYLGERSTVEFPTAQQSPLAAVFADRRSIHPLFHPQVVRFVER